MTDDEKRARADDIADQLSDTKRWLTHGRSIRISDLEQLRLRIVDYSQDPALNDAICRYHALMHLTFRRSSIYKIFETPETQIYDFRQVLPSPQQAQQMQQAASSAKMRFSCSSCQEEILLQTDFKPGVPLENGCIRFPADNKVECPHCAAEVDLSVLRAQIEMQTGKPILTP